MNGPSRLNRHLSSDADSQWWQAYLRHLPLLGLGLISLLTTLYLMVQFSPTQLNWGWLPDVYLPFQIATFCTLFFGASFLTLNTRRGYLFAVFIQTIIFLKLQRVLINREVVLSLIGLFVIIEVVTTLLILLKNHANLSQKSRSHHRSRHS